MDFLSSKGALTPHSPVLNRVKWQGIPTYPLSDCHIFWNVHVPLWEFSRNFSWGYSGFAEMSSGLSSQLVAGEVWTVVLWRSGRGQSTRPALNNSELFWQTLQPFLPLQLSSSLLSGTKETNKCIELVMYFQWDIIMVCVWGGGSWSTDC